MVVGVKGRRDGGMGDGGLVKKVLEKVSGYDEVKLRPDPITV